MQNDLPPLGWLRAFEASARNLSFTGAARELNMTQSAVSQQIKSLEGYMGRPLFHRRARALELTKTGQSYLPVVRDAFRTLSHGTRAVTQTERDVLRVQCNLTFAIHWLAPRLGQFYAQHPDVHLNISTELWEPRDIADGADIEIRFSLRPSDRVHAELLAQDHYYPVCAPGSEPQLESLADHTLFDCVNMMGTWAVWTEEQGLKLGKAPITYASTYSVGLSAAAAGAGLALAHDAIADRLIAQGQLIAPFAHRAVMQEAYYLIQTPQAQTLSSAQAFTAWLRDELHSFYNGRDGTQA